jgi:hypothetical protein
VFRGAVLAHFIAGDFRGQVEELAQALDALNALPDPDARRIRLELASSPRRAPWPAATRLGTAASAATAGRTG